MAPSPIRDVGAVVVATALSVFVCQGGIPKQAYVTMCCVSPGVLCELCFAILPAQFSVY